MALLTQYTGGTATADGVTIGAWVGSQSEYNAIGAGNYDEHTLYYIYEDPTP